MPLICDAIGAPYFLDVPRPEGHLADGATWDIWVNSLRLGMAAAGIGGLDWLVSKLDTRCQIHKHDQGQLLNMAAAAHPEPRSVGSDAFDVGGTLEPCLFSMGHHCSPSEL